MGNKLEQLLNSLIEKGWKPRWEKVNKVIKTWIDEFENLYVLFDWELNWYYQRWWSMTELVSKWSWLWQFVCENGYNQYKKEYRRWYTKHNTKAEYWDEWDYEYYLIESSLKKDGELEDFLLSNIKIDE